MKGERVCRVGKYAELKSMQSRGRGMQGGEVCRVEGSMQSGEVSRVGKYAEWGAGSMLSREKYAGGWGGGGKGD